jgi:CBS domain-containing protein
MAQLLVVILNEPAHLPALLDAWQQIGVPGTTILDSASARRAKGLLHEVGLNAVEKLLSSSEVKNKTLLSIIPDDALLEKAITVTEQLTGDLDVPHRGLLFTVPINQVVGLIKTRPAAETPAAVVEAVASNGEPITRNTPVSVVDEMMALKPTIVQASTDLMSIAQAMLDNPIVNVACVVNNWQKLVGLLPLQNLVDDLFLQVIPEEFLSEAKGWENVLKFAQLSRTKTAGDAMIPAASVKNTDRIREAFHVMHHNKLSGVPIVNDQNEVTGYLALLELLSLFIKSQNISTSEGEQNNE